MRLAEEPLTKVTLNLFTADVEYLRGHHEWSTEIRWAIREYIQNQKRKKLSDIALSQMREPND